MPPPAPREVRRLIVLGSTGSIGTQTLQVVEHLNALHTRGEWPTRYEIVALAGGRNRALLQEQAERFRVREVALGSFDDPVVGAMESTWRTPWGDGTQGRGAEAVTRLIRRVECDLVVAAMSGVAGLPATLAAVELGRDVALANKETLVAAGDLVAAAARRTGARLLPVDSEHSGVWQCLGGDGQTSKADRQSGAAPPMQVGDEVARVVLTASGGPFRTWTPEQMERATPEQALKHPTWTMGPKVTIDSASLMNKALEVIEAHWLFDLPPERIGVLIHPQSIVHALVEFADGSVVAQLGAPDMKTPIQHALTWPRRADGCSTRMSWSKVSRLEFEEVDAARFPALDLAYRAIREGSGAVLNAANEVAVQAFLAGRIGLSSIPRIVRQAMDRIPARPAASLDDVVHTDRLARDAARGMIGG